MSWLKHDQSGRRVPLESTHLVGRGERSSLRLTDPRVSSEHASLRWDGATWHVRDLGSLNRTSVNGSELAPGASKALSVGDRITFGATEEVWILETNEPPQVMAVTLSSGQTVVEQAGILALPTFQKPEAVIYRSDDGTWAREAEGTMEPVSDQMVLRLGEEEFRLCIPQATQRTRPVRGFEGCRTASLEVSFFVSSDLEHIEILVQGTGAEKRLPPRSHNELLLILARIRQRDAQSGLPPINCGWIHQEDLEKMVRLDSEHVNVQVFRIRRQFSELGLLDPAHIIERRPRTRQLRFGAHMAGEVSLL